jgi:ATP-binding cassette, subfamily B, multidrug efflux pump
MNYRLKKLFNYLLPHWKNATLGIIALFIVNGLGVYIPLLIRDSIEKLRTSLDIAKSLEGAIPYIILIIILTSIMWFIRMSSRILLFGVGRQVEFDLKQRIFEHLLKLEPAYFAANTAGDIINRATSDLDNIRRLLGFAVLSLANTIFAYTLTLPVMLLINVKLTLLVLLIYPLMLVAVKLFSEKLRVQQMTLQEELSTISDLIQEDMSGISLIKIYAQEENERKAFREMNQNLLDANLKLGLTRNILFPVIEGLASLSLVVLLWLGSIAISQGEITIGDLLALIIFSERLVFPTALLGFTITAYLRGEVSIDRIEAIFEVQPKIADQSYAISLNYEEIKGEIAVKNLTYKYPNIEGEKTTIYPALKNVNLTINAGETVAIVGPIGSGKSTFANALPRLLDVDNDSIFLDGKDITQIKIEDLRKAIAYVPQESFLFSTSIKNNIAYGDPLAPQKRIEISAKQAQIYQEIENFPQAYDTIVGERGITLSGGQRQRTALARALLIDAPILILDDALSSVDNQTATAILQNLSTGTKRKTVIFISHQLSAAATADRLIVMDKGEIVQIGTHAELVQQEGLYKNLWQQHQLEELLS